MSNDGMISIIGNSNTTVVDGNNSLIVAGNGNDTLAAGSTSIVTAGNGNDTITVGANSAIAAGNGNDTLISGSGSIVIAGNGNDTVAVGADSAITVGNGNDTLTAGANSIVIAGNGNDIINLGANDIVTVGNGKDIFVLPGDGQVTLSAPQSLTVSEDGTVALAIAGAASGFGWGLEDIFGFNASNDKIQLSSAQFANFAAVMAAAKQVGSNTVITADAGDSIVLNNVKLSSLTAKDFAFTAAPALVYKISGIPADATLTDTAGPIQVVNGTVTLTQAQLAGLTLKAGEVTTANLVVTATDPTTGNSVSKTVALSVTPVAPTLHTPASLNVASGASVALGITETPFDARDTVSITISGVPADATLSAGTKNADGSWTLTPAQLTNLTLKAGAATTASLTVTATNTQGQTASSPAAHIQLTIASPLSVTFDKVIFTDTGVQGDHLTDVGKVTLSGTLTDTIAVSTVKVYNAGALIGSATINPDHTWTLTATLGEGNYNQLSVTATDIAGTKASASTSQYVVIDTTAPTVNSQSESNPGLTQSTTEIITVNASDAHVVQSVAIYNDVTQQKVGDATLSNGVWTYQASGLTDGTYKFYAVVTDAAGNQTKTADLTTVTVDTTGPTVVSESESVSGPTRLTTDIIKVNATDPNGVASVAIYDHATNQKVGDAALGSDGAWAYTASNLTGGAHTFYAVVTDKAGNHTTSSDLATVTVDNTPPVISFGQVKLDNPDSTGTMSNDGGATLSGTVSDNVAVAQVQVFDGATLLGTANVANGTWSLHTTLGLGSHDQLHAIAADTAGNSTNIASHSVVTITEVAGLATDGYISGATVFADTNGNGKLDAGEASGITDSGGHFVLGTGTTSGPLVLIGGTDTATGQQFTGVLTAPTGSTQVTALTTLVQSVAAANGGDVAVASQSVAAALGIDPTIDLTKTDILTNAYTGDAQPFVAAAKVLNTVSMVASAVSGTGASTFTSAATGAFSALAAQIVSTGGLNLSDSSVVNAVVTSTLTSAGATLTGTQTSEIANVVTSVNTATDQAVQASTGGSTADLLANVSATSIVAQGSASADLKTGTQSGDLSSAVANNTSTALSTAVQGAVSQVSTASLAPAAPNFVSLSPTDASPTAASAVHYLLTFSNSVQGVTASDFTLTTSGLTGAGITSVTSVAGSAGAQYLVEINPGSGNGTLSLSFAGTTVQDLSGAALQDQGTHTSTSYTVDHSAGEQAALALTVTNTQVNAAGSALLNFTIAGLQPTDTGVVTFTDGQNSVSVNVNGGQGTYTANLGALSDGPISSQLAVNTNAAGHSFTPVAGSSAVTLAGFNAPSTGISVVQNATGDIAVASAIAVTNQSGIGLLAQETAGGIGNIVVHTTGSVTDTGSGSIGLEAQNLDGSNGGNVSVTATGGVTGNQHAIVASTAGSGNVSVETGGAITSAVQFGIRAAASGTGDVSVLTDAGSTINSGGAGISAINFDTVLAASANSSVTVTNNAVINSGTTLNPSGSVPQGIAAGFYGANGTSNTAINGTVVVNNNANITAAAGYAVDAYNWGNGDVTLNEAGNTSASGVLYGLAAYALSKGTGNVALNVGANASVTASSGIAIQAYVSGVGNVSVQTGDGDTIYGGSIGVNAQSQAISEPATGNINVVLGKDAIHSGVLNTPSGSATPGAVSVGYLPNGAQAASNAVLGNVTVQSDAQITADKANGINAYNWGKGNVTVSTGPDSTIHAAGNGIQANALNGGNVSVTNGGSITSGATGISANSNMGLGTVGGTVTVVNNGTITAAGTGIGSGGNHVGAISITNNGTVTATQFAGIGITAVSGDATITNVGATTGTNGIFASDNGAANVSITNQGTATGTSFSGIGANLTAAGATGSISITNSGTVTSLGSGSAIGLSENTTGTVTINNSGIIGSNASGQAIFAGGGDIAMTNSGTITGNINVGNGTFNNLASGVWAVGTWSGFGTASTTGVVKSNTVNNAGTINLSTGASINGANGLVVNNSGHIDNLSGTNMINGSVNNTGTLEVASGSLEIGGGLSGSGSVLVDTGATLVLDGASTQSVTFTGAGGTLNLNSGAVSGTIAAVSSTGGTFNATGAGNITTASGDALDFTASGGNAGNPASLVLTPSGTLTGAAAGLVASQNGVGDVTINASGAVSGLAGDGIVAQDSASGTGNISVTATGGVNASGTTSVLTGSPLVQTTQGYAAIRAQNLDTANNGNVTVTTSGALTGSQFGIRAQTSGSGNVSVTTDATSVINSGGSGISVVNFDTSMSASANSTIMVTAHGSINAGSMVNPNGSTPAAINASYYANPVGTITPVHNDNVNGTVLVTSDAIINSAGYGIQANNFGNGNVTVNETGGSITSTGYGINAYIRDIGSVSVSTSSGVSINSNGTGINAASQAVFDASHNATVTVINYATIQSGAVANGSTLAGIIAGFSGTYGLVAPGPNAGVNGTVLVDNYGNISAAKGYGIDAYNWGNGDVTVNDGAGTTVTGNLIGVAAFGLEGVAGQPGGTGNVSITVGANATVNSGAGNDGIQAYSLDNGNVGVTTADSLSVNAGRYGIGAFDQSSTVSAGSTLSVIAGTGTINAIIGGINAGYSPGSNAIEPGVAGNVSVVSNATIVVTGSNGFGIGAFNWGTGDATVTTGAASNVTATNGTGNAINASTNDGGNVTISNAGVATGGGTGINGFVAANAVHAGTISVTNTGTATGNSFSGINANDSAGGNVSISNSGSATGMTGISAFSNGAGSISITNGGAATGTTFSGIGANLTAAGATGSISLTNSGTVTSLGNGSAIGLNENNTGTVTINNTGIIGSNATGQAIFAGGGDITLTNSGTIDGNINVGNGTFNNQASGVWAVGTWSGFGTASTTGVVESNTVNNAGTINLSTGASINGANGLVVNNSGHIDNLSGINMINGAVNNTGTLEVASGSLEIGGGLSGTGAVLVDAGATLVLDGASAQTVSFTGSGGTLNLNFGAVSGTIAAVSSTGGNFAINGFGAVTAAAGDGIDFTATGGSSGNKAAISVAPGGAITGAANGIVVTQNGTGDISVSTSGPTVGQTGTGILAQDSASGVGNIQVVSTGSVTGSGAAMFGIEAQNLNASNGGNVSVTATGGVSGNQHGIVATTAGSGNVSVEAAGAINSTVQFGIRAGTLGTGNVSVLTDPGSTINSGGAGISAINQDTVIAGSSNTTVTVTNNAVINSGTTLNPSGSVPQSIAAGFYGANGTANTNINGTVVINNNANVTAAAGYGLNGYNYGNGNVTLNEGANTSVTADQYGLGAFANSKGSGSVAINVGANVAIHATNFIGIQTTTTGVGDINIQTGDGDTIYGGSIGVNAQSQATSEPATGNVMVVLGNDIIHSGTHATGNGGATPGAVSVGYAPGGNGTATNAVLGNVTVQSNAQITADAAVGINAYNWGKGNITVSTGSASSITAPSNGIQASAQNGGNVSITNGGSIHSGATGISGNAHAGLSASGGSVTITNNGTISAGTVGIFAGGNHVGNVSVTNTGTVNGASSNGIAVNLTASGSTGSTIITNSGTVTTASTVSAISVNENAAGTVTLNNSGTIGSSVSAGAIFEAGGSQVTINNSGTILGGVSIGATTTFNNNAGGVWQTANFDDEGTINAAGAGSQITITSASIGLSGTGSLNLSAGATFTAGSLSIGNQAGGHGTVVVTGAGTSLNATTGQFQNLQVGGSGLAALSIADHAAVSAGNMDVGAIHAAGIVDTLDINNATLTVAMGLTIGDAGTAHATVENGGSISASYLGLGSQAGGDGSLTIDGAGSHLAIQGNADGINVGLAGNGHLTLLDGATLTAAFVNIASLAGTSGDLTISGAGTSLDTSSGLSPNIQVGNDGTATMTISDHATVTTTNMMLAVNHDAGVTDTLTIDDASLHASGILTIGNSGSATVLVENGGSLTANTLALAELAGSSGSLTVDGAGSVVTASYLSLGGSSAVLALTNGGAIDIGSSAATMANTIHIGGDGSLVGTGEIASTIVNDGTLRAAGGTLQVDQQLTGTGSADIDIGATLHLANGAASSQTILFNAPSGSTASLVVDHAASLQAFITGFTGNGSLGGSDQIDLKDINYSSLSESYDAVNNVLNISDGTNSAAIHFNGSYQQANFNFVSDGQNGTIVYDPPVAGSTTAGSGTSAVAEGDGFKFAAASVAPSAVGADASDAHGNASASLGQVLNMHVDALAPPSSQALDLAFVDSKLLPGHDYHVL